jgi:hypothetical protein
MTPILEITFTVADSKCVSDEHVSRLRISDQGGSALWWFESALPTEYGSEEEDDRSLALALGLGLGLSFVLLSIGGFFLFRMMRQVSNKDSSQEESEFEVESPSNTGASWTGDDRLA